MNKYLYFYKKINSTSLSIPLFFHLHYELAVCKLACEWLKRNSFILLWSLVANVAA